MLDAPYWELDEADVGLRHIVLRWQCPAGVSSVMGCGGCEVLRLPSTCIY